MKPMIIVPLVLAAFTIAALAGSPQNAGVTQMTRPAPAPASPQEILLWENGAPGALGQADTDKPAITAYRAPRGSSGTAIVVAPGGGYGALAIEHEGRQWAYWYNAMGITAFVLKYRLGPRYHHPIELDDAQRAIRTVRSRAAEFNIVPDRIGMMGFSAGGHLTSTAGTHFDSGKADSSDPIERVSSRPDFLILGYPVISFDPAVTHAGSLRNLLGENPDPKLVENLSNDLQVTAQTPPTFIFHTTNDAAVPVENSVRFYLALRKAKVPVEMHLFENGPHGVGMALNDPSLSSWPNLLMNWMRARGLLTKPASTQ
ncbi:MAG TPA: alpha/beta hydrolase [Vicinamibacterales bacterium]|nr:alpha/beta hydrolase [Vicinamibacterales bacterium]